MPDQPHLSYLPTGALTYDPSDDHYWDPDAVATEVRRAFEICHGCRMCFKYCDTFPDLFRLIDEQHDGDVGALTEAETESVLDSCFQCKLCEVQCPYTPRDGHEFQLDFPRLVHRQRAVRARTRGVPFRDRVLGNPDGSGRMARASLGLANVMNRVRLHRIFMEKALGIHRDKLLPPFARTTFERWARRQGRMRSGPGVEAVLFQTCYVQNNTPELGRDVLEVLDRNGVSCACVAGLACCGMPAWEHGDLETVRKLARRNLDLLMPYVEAGAKVLVINPTCSMMLRRDLPELLEGEERERARVLADAVQDVGEFVWSLRGEERFNTEVATRPTGPVAYHAPCHLRAQAVGFKGRDLLRKILGVRPVTVMECCGHDGTFAMTVEGFEASQRVGKRAFDDMKGAETELWATDCPLAAIQFAQHAGRLPLHPMTILARAYRGEPLPGAATSPRGEDEEQE